MAGVAGTWQVILWRLVAVAADILGRLLALDMAICTRCALVGAHQLDGMHLRRELCLAETGGRMALFAVRTKV